MPRQPLTPFSRPDYLQQDAQGGTIHSRAGTRLILVNEDFLRGFVVAVEHEVGDSAPLVMHRCGTYYGQRLARRIERELNELHDTPLRDRPMLEFTMLLRDMWRGYGLGRLDVDWSQAEVGFLPMSIEASPMQDIGPTGRTGEHLFAGLLEGFFTHFAGAPMVCVQTGDRRLGSKDGTTFLLGREAIAKRIQNLQSAGKTHREIVAELTAAQ